tara:strand:- start:342 stop:1010 length:669 start_codon:yes stop_codon:yes gene_type:complete
MSMTLHDIVKYLSKIFERKKDNAVSLPNDAALSSDLKRVKIGEENTPMELSKTELRVQGTINADAINVNGSAVQTGTDAAQNWFITSAFYQGNANARYIPLAGGSIAEQSSLIDYTIDDTNYIVPYDLKINTIYANITKPNSGSTDPDNTNIRLYKNGSTLSSPVTVDLSSVGYDLTNIHNVYTWDFSGETNTYSAADVMQINIDPTNTMYYVSITVVGEYT